MANSALRPIVAPRLKLSHYLFLRILCPLLAYALLSLTFSLVCLAFKLPFGGGFVSDGLGGVSSGEGTKVRAWWLFWVVSWLLMSGLGLATEWAISVLTVKFAPFFLLTLVSCSSLHLILVPRKGKGNINN